MVFVSEDALYFPPAALSVDGRPESVTLSAVLMTRCSDFLSARVVLPRVLVLAIVRMLSTSPP